MVKARRARRHPRRLKAVEPREHVLIDRLHRYRADVVVAKGFEQALRIRAIGLVAQHIGPHRVGREQHHAVPASARLAAPEVRRPAGLHHHRGRSLLGEEARELSPREAMALRHLPWPLRHRDLEHRLGKIHCDRRSMHLGLLLPGSFRGARRLWHIDAAQVAGGVHLITAADRLRRRLSGIALGVSKYA